MAVIDRNTGIVVVALLATCGVRAAVLPEDRADVLYHAYDGGGVEVVGPAVQIRKKVGEQISLTGKYYVDTITSASIDVVTSASPYEEERTEFSVGGSYLHGKSTLSAGYTNSEENDFTANSAYFDLSMDMFGDLTTVTLGYSLGFDEVRATGSPDFSEDVDRQQYRLGVAQVLTKNWLLDAGLEVITDEGFLNNPYRSVRYLDATNARGYSFQPERYPNTRTSTALALRSRYYLPYRAAVHTEVRGFDDSWGITAANLTLGYTHPYKDRWTLDLKYRFYTQEAAEFYSDLFERQDFQNFLARDKELSTFSSHTLGFSLAYRFPTSRWQLVRDGSVNLAYDRILFDYDDFTDLTANAAVGEEPLYSFSADVLQLYLSLWY